MDAATGKLLWKFDSGVEEFAAGAWIGSIGPVARINRRILAGVMNFVYALNAATGQPIQTFGKQGRIDLSEGLGRDAEAQSIALTSPGIVYEDLLIVGGREPETLPAPPGDIRAIDIRTGKTPLVVPYHPARGRVRRRYLAAGCVET